LALGVSAQSPVTSAKKA